MLTCTPLMVGKAGWDGSVSHGSSRRLYMVWLPFSATPNLGLWNEYMLLLRGFLEICST